MPPRKTSQRTARKRQRQACLEDADFIRPSKQQVGDENAPPDGSLKETRYPSAPPKQHVVEESKVLCRQEETSRLQQMLLNCIRDEQGAAIYIPGQPGTGKTHTVRTVCSAMSMHELSRPLPACVLINCQDASSSLPRVCLAGLREAHTVMCKFNIGGTCSHRSLAWMMSSIALNRICLNS